MLKQNYSDVECVLQIKMYTYTKFMIAKPMVII